MRAIELTRRHQVIAAWQHGMPTHETASLSHVSERTVRRWVARWQATGSIAPRRSTGRRPRIPSTAADNIEAVVLANPTATLARLCELWAQRTGDTISAATMSRTLTRFGWVKHRIS
jgi:transposase